MTFRTRRRTTGLGESPSPSVSSEALAVASAWPYISGCSTFGAVAMPPGMGRIEDFHAVTDIRSKLSASGAGAWTRGVLYLDMSAVTAKPVVITNIQPHITRRDLAPPAWIYKPTSGCGPKLSDRIFSFDLDGPRFTDEGLYVFDPSDPPANDSPRSPLGPGFVVSDTQHAVIRIESSSCRGNYEWNIDVQYVMAGSRSIDHYIVGPFQSFGVANNTKVYEGTQDATGSVQVERTSTLTGNDPVLNCGEEPVSSRSDGVR